MSEVAILGLLGAKETLMRGFTTVRDIGGNPFAVKKFADAGTFPGPRMYISGAPIGRQAVTLIWAPTVMSPAIPVIRCPIGNATVFSASRTV